MIKDAMSSGENSSPEIANEWFVGCCSRCWISAKACVIFDIGGDTGAWERREVWEGAVSRVPCKGMGKNIFFSHLFRVHIIPKNKLNSI